METIIRFPENGGLQYVKIEKRVEDVRKGTDLIGFNALLLNQIRKNQLLKMS
jgi:hypothetical protein